MIPKGPWLGQIPLVLGPSSWGAGMVANPAAIPATPVPPFFGQWAVFGKGQGRVGPFENQMDAFYAAIDAATSAGAKALPTDGFAQVFDSMGRMVGPVT
jgi:hypothetical protein